MEEKIKEKMHELEKILDYEFKDIELLASAMSSEKIKAHKDHENDSLATLGDAVLKFVLTDYFFKPERLKGDITGKRSELENNDVLYEICNKTRTNKTRIIDFAHKGNRFYPDNDIFKNDKVRNPKEHTPYIEAIIGAIFHDRGYKASKRWIKEWYIPEAKLLKPLSDE